ncbi:MAG: helix-turn-helix transcriptional regulator [Planctomycetota bacterium]|jgi:excisionase family DNA binding protein
MEKELWTVKDVAAALSVSPRQVWKLISSGGIVAPVRIARSVRFRRNEILRWIAAGCPARDRWEATQEACG